MESHSLLGMVDVLHLVPALAVHPTVEQAIRQRAARYAVIDPALLAQVRGVDRRGDVLNIVADVQEGVRLSQLLADLEFGNVTLPDATLLELAASVVHVVASLHTLPGLIAHGAINPAHVVIRRDGTAILTDGAFGAALETLQWNREQVWREFSLALPVSASMHRFDQRTDITQLASVVLAIALRRLLRREEYPRGAAELVLQATPIEGGPAHASALRMWLQQALQLHPRCVLRSAVDAHQMFAQVIAAASNNRRAALRPLQELMARSYGKHGISEQRAS